MAYNVELADSIKNYIEQNKDILATKTATVNDSSKYFNLQTGVLAETEIHTLSTGLEIQDGSNCAFTPDGSSTVSGRRLVPAFLKVQAEFCAKDFLKTIYNKQTSIAMGRGALPLEEQFVQDILAGIKVENERLIWAGDTSNGDLMDGLTTIIANDSAIPAGNKFTSTKTDAFERLQEMYAKVDDKDYVVFCSTTMYRTLINDLLNKNFLVAGYEDANGMMELTLPACGLKVIGVDGIPATDTNFYGLHLEDMYMGIDAQGDNEKFDFWFSEDNRTYRLDVEWVLAVNYLFSERVYVYGI